MTQEQYGSAKLNLIDGCNDFTQNDFIKSIIPDKITKSIDLLVAYFITAQSLIFKDLKVVKLSLLNIVSWWKFLKLSYKFIKDIVEVWK
jgi:hypothetical protein